MRIYTCKNVQICWFYLFRREFFNCNADGFLCTFITLDKTWIHETPENKHQSEQWISPTILAPIGTDFWNERSIIYIHYLQKDRTTNSEYYENLLDRFNKDLKKKQLFFISLQKKVVFSISSNNGFYFISSQKKFVLYFYTHKSGLYISAQTRGVFIPRQQSFYFPSKNRISKISQSQWIPP